jgi:putative endonuclease
MSERPGIALGAAGERHARTLLERRGYRFIASNWRCTAGEIDIVMADGPELVFIEVKTRRGEASGRAEEAISAAKGRRLLAAGEWFVSTFAEWQQTVWRVDLVAITIDRTGHVVRVTHVENAILAG